MSDAITGVDTADYMKLFMQELTYQDPMKPVDNREFMSQMAQFSALQLAQDSNESIKRLVGMTVGNQALSLLGKNVRISGTAEFNTVKSVRFEGKEGPKLTVSSNGQTVDIILDDISDVQL